MIGMKSLFVCAVIALLETVLCTPTHAQRSGGNAAPKSAIQPDQAVTEKSVLTEGSKQVAKSDAAAGEFCQCVGQDDSAAVARIEHALLAPLHSAGLDYADQPLQDVVSSLQEEYGIPIQLDKPSLEEAGIGTDAAVNVTLHNISLRSALRLTLKKLQLTYLIQDEVLLITTNQAAEANLKTCVYDIRGIIGDRDEKAVDSLIDTIESCVATETWAENGSGQADIRSVKPGLFVITQTQAVHDDIRSLLTTLRKMRNDRSPDVAATPSAPQKEKVVTRSYLLQLNPTKDIDTMRTQVRELITQSLPDETWSGQLGDGEAVTLTVFHDRVVVRHTPAVQEKVHNILADSGVATPAQPTSVATFAPGGSGPEGPGVGVPGAAPGPGPEGGAPGGVAPGIDLGPGVPNPNPFQ